MKLAKALKVKNRRAGEIAQAQKLIVEANVVEESNDPAHDVEALYKSICDNQERLAELKAAIAVANGPIARKILDMAEYKARIAFLRSIPTKDGSFVVEGRYGSQSTTREYHATLKASWVEKEIIELSVKIDGLQDEIDAFNATTEISL